MIAQQVADALSPAQFVEVQQLDAGRRQRLAISGKHGLRAIVVE